MEETTPFVSAVEQGDPRAAGRLLPLVYDELRRLAARRLGREAPGQSLRATALVHEAYPRLVGGDPDRRWDGRGHVGLDLGSVPIDAPGEDLIDLDEALTALGVEDPLRARPVAPRFFAGLTQAEAAEALGLARRTADRHWAYARAWLIRTPPSRRGPLSPENPDGLARPGPRRSIEGTTPRSEGAFA